MIVAIADRIRSDKRLAAGVATAAVGVIAVVTLMAWPSKGPTVATTAGDLPRGKVEHVRSGGKVVLDGGEEVVYAGIRAPFEGEALAEEAQKRNEELVGRKTVRLRYDEVGKDKKDRFVAYVFAGGEMVNERLVREGLAYVQLASAHRRFEKELLAAQLDAHKHRRGLWSLPVPDKAPEYPADPKYANFHRPSCEEVPKINPERLTSFGTRSKAFEAGFAPCSKCRP